MAESLKPFVMAIAVMMEFQRLGMFKVPEDLLHQCIYEGYILARKNPEWAKDLPELVCRSSGTDYGVNWYYSEEVEADLSAELFDQVCVDCSHLGLGNLRGIQLSSSARLQIQDGFLNAVFRLDHPALAVIVSTVKEHLREEASLKTAYKHDLHDAERGVVGHYQDLATRAV